MWYKNRWIIRFDWLTDRLLITGEEEFKKDIDYAKVWSIIKETKNKSLEFLKMELEIIDKEGGNYEQ